MQLLTLKPHPQSHPDSASQSQRLTAEVQAGIEAGVEAQASTQFISVHFHLEGLDGLELPSTGASALKGRGDRLWEHTCFEVFIQPKGQLAYREYNVSPSGLWAAYAFSDRRVRDESLDPPELDIHVQRSAQALDVSLRIPVPDTWRQMRLGLSSVLEDTEGRRSHWALVHPGEVPDFHHPESFALRIEP